MLGALGFTLHRVKASRACYLCEPQATIKDLDEDSYRERDSYCAAWGEWLRMIANSDPKEPAV